MFFALGFDFRPPSDIHYNLTTDNLHKLSFKIELGRKHLKDERIQNRLKSNRQCIY